MEAVLACVDFPVERNARKTQPQAIVGHMACVVEAADGAEASCTEGGTEAAIVVQRSEAVDPAEAHSIAVDSHRLGVDGAWATAA